MEFAHSDDEDSFEATKSSLRGQCPSYPDSPILGLESKLKDDLHSRNFQVGNKVGSLMVVQC
jgi:hypothetical protein